MNPIDPEPIRSVLVIKPDHIGDLMLAVPALVRIRRFFPRARIDLLGLASVHSFSLAHGLIDRVLPFESPWLTRLLPTPLQWPPLVLTLRRLRRARYDVVINLRYDLRDLLLTAATGARWTISYRYREQDLGITFGLDVVPDEHEARRWVRLLEGAEIRVPDATFAPRINDAVRRRAKRILADLPSRRPVVGLHMRSRTPAKNWPRERWVELLRRIDREAKASIVLVGAEEDHAFGESVASEAEADACANAAGRFSLADLPALIGQLDLLVGVDSGPAHLAGLLGVPVAALFSKTNDPRRWRPAGERVVILQSAEPCALCDRREMDRDDHPCMARITVDEAVRVVQDVFHRNRAERAKGGGR